METIDIILIILLIAAFAFLFDSVWISAKPDVPWSKYARAFIDFSLSMIFLYFHQRLKCLRSEDDLVNVGTIMVNNYIWKYDYRSVMVIDTGYPGGF